ncbi:uncharacterized protein LOC129723281 [Wyeomyia smithii]|uniref:uncharacterized protein LOC129723281 n=1 Tax=Wyeomyia smithii TaxID=174621 RepID=UPI0024681188|nr:uncharacterized protein LOC129723281 [Wyeomyia smithii]
MIAVVQQQTKLVEFLQYLVLTYIVNNSYCTVIYYDYTITSGQQECNQYCEFFAAVNTALDGYPVMWIRTEDDKNYLRLNDAIEHGCQSYITVTRDVMDFIQLKLDLKETTLQRIRDKNILMYYENNTLLDSTWFTREALKIYPNLWFIVPSGPQKFDFYTQNYSQTAVATVQLVDSYDFEANAFTGPGVLFYDKLFDLAGRSVDMGVSDYVPYCMTSHVGANQGNVDAANSDLSKEYLIDGLEGTLIVEFCKLRNCNIKLWPFGPSGWGDIYDNGTGYGETYATYMKQTELSVCCVYYDWYFHLLDGSTYIAKSTVVLLVPKAKPRPTYLTLIYPFTGRLWLSISVMLVIMTGVHHLITSLNVKHSNDRNAVQPPIEKSIFDMISIYLDQGIFPNSVSTSYRLLISFILLSGVVLSNSYSGGLASVLTVPKYEKPINTIHDFVLSPFRWAAQSIAWIFALIGAESYDIQQIVKKFDEVPDEDEMYRRSLKGDYSIGIELLNGGAYAYNKAVRAGNVASFHMMKEYVYFAFTIGYTQRGWPLMEYFNKFSQESIQHGFVIAWERQAIRKYTSIYIQQVLSSISGGDYSQDEEKPLTVEHILGSLFVLLFGLSASLIIFIVEIGWHTMKRKLTIMKLKLRTKTKGQFCE